MRFGVRLWSGTHYPDIHFHHFPLIPSSHYLFLLWSTYLLGSVNWPLLLGLIFGCLLVAFLYELACFKVHLGLLMGQFQSLFCNQLVLRCFQRQLAFVNSQRCSSKETQSISANDLYTHRAPFPLRLFQSI